MSWMRKLYDTYDRCDGKDDLMSGEHVLLPMSHTSQNVNIKVILDKDGNFRGAELLGKMAMTIPATEKSSGRTGKIPPPHPLIDKIRYCGGDYAEYGKSFFNEYKTLICQWDNSEHNHPKVHAVYMYIVRAQLVSDLVQSQILEMNNAGELCSNPGLFKNVKEPGDALVCWSVEGLGVNADTWSDPDLQKAWAAYDASRMSASGLCMLTGTTAAVAAQHPRNIRRPGDGAKLISSNDNSGFTFRGKFDTPNEASTVGYEATQKAHHALRWLIARQGSRQGDQVILAWAVGGQEIPNPVDDEWFLKTPETPSVPEAAEHAGTTLSHVPDVGQHFSLELKKALAGYSAKLNPTDEITILGLDAATPGRLSVIFHREKSVEEYLGALRAWQEDCAWLLRKRREQKTSGKSKDVFFRKHCAPTPREVTLAAYGKNADDKLAAATRERLLPCIADRTPLPIDLMLSAVRRASRRSGLDAWEWEHTLGVACALYRGYHARHPKQEERRIYAMALEPERTSRDYLYGRLLAVAERIESQALFVAKENRPTNAERLMQRFADRPMETWKTLEQALQPYRQRLLQSRGAFLVRMDKLLDEILSLFKADEFISDEPLSGEYLLGYHCQRQALWNKKSDKNEDTDDNTEGEE